MDFSCDVSKGNSLKKLSFKLYGSHVILKIPTFRQKHNQLKWIKYIIRICDAYACWYKNCELTLTNYHCKSIKVILAPLKSKTRLNSVKSSDCIIFSGGENWREIGFSTGAWLVRGGVRPCSFLKIEKSALIFIGKKCPDCVLLWVQFLI